MDAIVSPANSFGFMDGGIDMVRELVLFILADCEIIIQQRPGYVALYRRPAVSAKFNIHIGLYMYFNPPDGHHGHAIYTESIVAIALCTHCRPMVLD